MPTLTITNPASADSPLDDFYQHGATPAGTDARTGAMPQADGGEPDFDDDVALNTPDDDEKDDDEEEDTTA